MIRLLLGTYVAVALALALLVVLLDPPNSDMQQLAMMMSVSGTTTVIAAYVVYRQSVVRASLRWTLQISIVITILLVLLNVWITARLMFISQHDFRLMLALLLFAAGTSILFGLYMAQTITARLRKLSVAAGAVANGQLDTRLTIAGNDEITRFADTFNWMAERLQTIDRQKQMMEQARRDLIAGISHDLRTPLTSVRAMLEAILDDVVTEEIDIKRYMRQSLTEIGNLNLLIDDLFELSKIDAGHIDLDFVNTSLRDLISDTISGMGVHVEGRRLTLSCDLSPDIDPVDIAPEKIQRVLHNLLDNALRYTPPGGEVLIRAFRVDGKVQVEIHNTGATIEAQHLPHLFDSFYRIDSSRQATDGRRSTGLGLAIARGFVEAHRGTIDVHSDPQHGTTFRFAIPRTQV